MSIKKGMTVKIVISDPSFAELNNEIAEVKEVYEDYGVAIVKIPGGAAKVPISSLVEYTEKKSVDQKPGARRITKEAFEIAIDKVTELSPEKIKGENGFLYMLTRLAAQATGAIIMKDLFENNSEVELTEDELILMLWDKCNPVNISKHIKVPGADPKAQGISLKKVTLISTTSFTYLEDLVNVLFPPEND